MPDDPMEILDDLAAIESGLDQLEYRAAEQELEKIAFKLSEAGSAQDPPLEDMSPGSRGDENSSGE